MSYRFKSGDSSVAEGVRRIAVEQVDRAIAEFDDSELDRHEAVHQVRKRCKKLRGLIRLVRPAFPAYRDENAAFRDAAKALSFLRDTAALMEAHDELIETYRDQIDTKTLATVRECLGQRQQEMVADRDLEGELEAFRKAMKKARRRAPGWELDEDGFAAIAGGLRKTHKRARKGMARAQAEGTAEAFHEWRKRSKYHWYHTRLLRPVWPEPMEAHEAAADKLGDLLGDHHDLAVLRATIAEDPAAHGEPETIEVFVAILTRRQQTLEAEALKLGARLFAEPTDALAERWGEWWEAWRSEAADDRVMKA